MKKNLWSAAKIAFTLFLVYWLLRSIEWSLVIHELRTLSWWLVGCYVALQFLSIFISVRKWQVIAAYKDIRFPFHEGLSQYLSGMFINNFLPSTIGGDIYRSLWLSKKTDTRSKAFSVILFDRFLGLWMTAFLALLGSIALWPYVLDSALLQVSYFILLGFFGADILVTVAYCQPWFPKLLAKLPFPKIAELIREIAHYTNWSIWVRGLSWSFLFAFVGLGVSNYLLFLALGYALPFFQFLGLIFLMALYVSIPISINNIGLKEWAYVALFSLLGISLEVAVTAALLSRIIQMMTSFLALPFYVAERRRLAAIQGE